MQLESYLLAPDLIGLTPAAINRRTEHSGGNQACQGA